MTCLRFRPRRLRNGCRGCQTRTWGRRRACGLRAPLCLQLLKSAEDVLQILDATWAQLQTTAALESELFSTPVEHFLVRAFLSDGIDEVMAHLIVLEAAFGLESDYDAKQRLPTDPHKAGATRRVAARLSDAIGRPEAAKEYLDLYDMRCTYVHGRPEGRIISTQQRVLARRLAREAAKCPGRPGARRAAAPRGNPARLAQSWRGEPPQTLGGPQRDAPPWRQTDGAKGRKGQGKGVQGNGPTRKRPLA